MAAKQPKQVRRVNVRLCDDDRFLIAEVFKGMPSVGIHTAVDNSRIIRALKLDELQEWTGNKVIEQDTGKVISHDIPSRTNHVDYVIALEDLEMLMQIIESRGSFQGHPGVQARVALMWERLRSYCELLPATKRTRRLKKKNRASVSTSSTTISQPMAATLRYTRGSRKAARQKKASKKGK